MWSICLLCWIFIVFLLLRDRKTYVETQEKRNRSLFEKAADGILSYPFSEKLYSEQVRRMLKVLYPAKDVSEACRLYYREKIALILKIFIITVHMIVLIFYSNQIQTPLQDGNKLIRGSKESDSESVTLHVNTEEETDGHEITYDVTGRLYSPKEIEGFIEQFLKEYELLIRGENESLMQVKHHLLLLNAYDGYPMSFSWTSSEYSIIDDDGTVQNKDLLNEQIVSLTVTMTYEETVYEHLFSVCVVSADKTDEEVWHGEILEEIQKADKKQKYTETLILPTEIAGKKVYYSPVQESPILFYFICLMGITGLIYFAKDNDLKKEVTLRRQKMNLKYPEFVSKFQLLLGAGISVRNIFWKISEDVSLGEELGQQLQLLVRDMKNGMSTGEALDRFGKRTGSPLYMKFSALLVQNLKKGTKDLLPQLSEEANEAFHLRKMQAKQLGEEAGTKLLLPMILLLAIVMAVLMIPAFLSFQF